MERDDGAIVGGDRQELAAALQDVPVGALSQTGWTRHFPGSWPADIAGRSALPAGELSEHLMLSVVQAASYLGRAEHEVLMLMKDGALACQWYGGEHRVRFTGLEIYRVRDCNDEAWVVEALLAAAESILMGAAIRAA